MKSKGKCRLCGEEVSFTVGNPVELGFHMVDRHNSGSVGQYDILEENANSENAEECTNDECDCAGKSDNKDEFSIDLDGSVRIRAGKEVRTAEHHENRENHSRENRNNPVQGGRKCPPTPGDAGKKGKRKFAYSAGLYKTTLETWTTAGGYVCCPSCSKNVRPLVRSQKNKVAYTSVGATFLLSCWPCCFLFPLMHKCSVDLYCPNCKFPLGTYDAGTGKTRPNCKVPNLDQLQL